MATKQFSFALIADTHVRSSVQDPDNEYSSDTNSYKRVLHVVEEVNALNPDFVIHLGDITHPIPNMTHYAGAVQQAQNAFAKLNCKIHYTPGNHDTCDKAHAFATAPTVDETSHIDFEKNWDQTYSAFDHQDCHFILLDSTLFNSGLKKEAEQKQWLENHLPQHKDKRIFIFMHYPLFLYSQDEHEHYDNIGLDARTWLLQLLKTYSIQAVFTGHSHYFFYNTHHNSQLYTLPSTTFVRPDFSDSTFVAPADEFGRNDLDKLGFFHVTVTDESFSVTPIRTFGRHVGETKHTSPLPQKSSHIQNSNALGVTLRHSWAKAVELPCDSLDEFNRKPVRNDYMLFALLELGIKNIRVPLQDFIDPVTIERIQDFKKLGFEFTAFTAGLPNLETQQHILKQHHLIKDLELILNQSEWEAASPFCQSLKQKTKLNLFLSSIKTYAENKNDKNFVFSHFLKHGFLVDDLAQITEKFCRSTIQNTISGLVFSLNNPKTLNQDILKIVEFSDSTKTKATMHLKMPRLSEGRAFTDDDAISEVVCAAKNAIANHPNLSLIFDTFMDHDRGYNPRHGFIDRRGNPRKVYQSLLQS